MYLFTLYKFFIHQQGRTLKYYKNTVCKFKKILFMETTIENHYFSYDLTNCFVSKCIPVKLLSTKQVDCPKSIFAARNTTTPQTHSIPKPFTHMPDVIFSQLFCSPAANALGIVVPVLYVESVEMAR